MSKEQLEDIKDEIKKHSSLEAVKLSEGGQLLIKSLSKDIISCINGITSGYKDLTHTELIALSARLSERMSMFNTLNRSSKNKKIAISDLKEIVGNSEEE